MNETASTILDFWLREVPQSAWYKANPDLDQQIRDRFQSLWEQGREQGGVDWPLDSDGALAACILFDQFSRNMFLGSAEAFATDDLARAIAQQAIDADLDQGSSLPVRRFFYMPFMHSEDLAVQDHGIETMRERLGVPDALLHARAHREIIRRFGRFPFRNEALGRTSTEEEKLFMESGGYGEVVREMSAEKDA